MTDNTISADFPYESHYVDIKGSRVHYIEEGDGDPILFLHGIPTSSYIWRNIIPHLSTLGRCIAPDLIGFGKSDKPAIAYTILDHIQYIEKFIETLNLKNITLVMHGWGSIIGFDYAMRHEENCKALIFYEAYLRSLNKDDISLPYEEQLLLLQEEENTAALDGIHFIDTILSQGMMRPLSNEEISHYQEPFFAKGAEKPLHQYLQEIPRVNTQTAVDKIIADYSKKLTDSQLPKLMLYSVPGFITTMATAMWAKENLPRLEINDVGEDLHYAQESHPVLMGKTISIWLQGIEQTSQSEK
ncbi:MAG TPA: haloalkane dehalogenase [Gammaproteobacteria bacterium]|nr:haloalkane dehalogenase [Gammaproteobacteria bacterium]